MRAFEQSLWPQHALDDTEQGVGHGTERHVNVHALFPPPPWASRESTLVGQLATYFARLRERDTGSALRHDTASWKIARPLGTAARLAARPTRVAQKIWQGVRRRGGLRNALAITYHIYRREGLQGLTRRLKRLGRGDVSPTVGSDGHDRNDYEEWIRRYDTLSAHAGEAMRTRIDAMQAKPVISVLLPTYNPKPEWMIDAIESVRGQIYPYWELCIADDASSDPSIRSILERYTLLDARIKTVFRTRNGHISAATNSALGCASGEWIALLDHDDLLTQDALYWVAETIERNPGVQLIYSDEDMIDGAHRRFAPHFKPDWNEDLFYSYNLISHLGVYRRDLLGAIGGFREGFEGSQDYDLALRCIERITPAEIRHVPRVLYHWRAHLGSAAQSKDAKPYALVAGKKALDEHFQRLEVDATTEILDPGYRVRYALPEEPPLVTIVIPTRNAADLVKLCIGGILEKTLYRDYEILLIDNASDDPKALQYFNSLRRDSRIRVIRDDRPFNYSALNNAGAKAARGKMLALVNNDIEVISPDWLTEMVSHAARPGIGVVGARLWYPNERLQHGGVVLGVGGVAGHAHKGLIRGEYGYIYRATVIQSLSAVTAACAVVRKDVYEEVGGFNENNLAVAFNDVDFCIRVLKAGYRNIWTPFAELYHHESAGRGSDDAPAAQARFAQEVRYMQQHWHGLLTRDPAYNRNLTLHHTDFSLAWPPRADD